MSFGTIPPEILEHIAYFVATHELLGPPSNLISLLLTNRTVNSCLSFTSNPHLYGLIFEAKFDSETARERLGADSLSPNILAVELKRRFVLLKRIRARVDSIRKSGDGDSKDNILDDIMITSYLMMLENNGKNEKQMREYAKIGEWLREYWFHESGASHAVRFIRAGRWPPNIARTCLAMWMFWFLLDSDQYPNNNDGPDAPLNVLKIHALGAHLYNLTLFSWVDYVPMQPLKPATSVTWYSEKLLLTPPPLAIPAILSFLALVNKHRLVPLPPSDPSIHVTPRNEWNAEWGRCVRASTAQQPGNFEDCFNLGSFEGVWEGFFTYTEFTAYAAILAGAPPQVLQKSVLGRHQQTWKLREHHLFASDPALSTIEDIASIDLDAESHHYLPAGDPLRSYFPTGTKLVEDRDGLLIQEPGRKKPLVYHRAGAAGSEGKVRSGKVVDVVITGEGHSAWGQFNLVGRVRPYDGFISLAKDYVDGDRGKWLYRGYLVGNKYGNFVGRWRDTLSPIGHPGYEGCFAMSRRR